MRRLTECEELFDGCDALARDSLSLLDVLVLAGFALLVLASWLALRGIPAEIDADALRIHSHYEERVQYLQALKSGRLWGDIGQTQPEEALPPPSGSS